MKVKKPTTTVLVVAYNEENNIEKFVYSVLAQEEKKLNLEKILIISDGSTDNTVKLVNKIKSKKIQVISHINRVGKSSRLNEVYSNLNTDYLIQSDADVILAHPKVLQKVIEVMQSNKKIMMCGGNPTPVKAVTFLERSVNVTVETYLQFRRRVNKGHNAFSADGRFLAFRKEFIQKVRVPSDMIANDAYVYLVCKKEKFQYRFIKNAVVYFRSPQTITDQLRQNSRFTAAPIRMKRYFSTELLKKEYSIPVTLYYSLILKAFFSHPIECLTIFIVNNICKMLALLNESKMNAKWAMAISSKRIVPA